MKFLHVMALGLTASLFAIISCSSGMNNMYSGGGTRCATGYDPLPIDVSKETGFSKVSDSDNNDPVVFSENTAGSYTYLGADAFFKDTTGLLVHVNIRADNDQNSVVNRTCVDGMSQFVGKSTDFHFSDSIAGLRGLTTNSLGRPVSFQIENLGYIYSSDPRNSAITPTNCDLSDDPAAPPMITGQDGKKIPDPSKCGKLSPTTIKSADVTSLETLFPTKNKATDKLTVWCQDQNPGSCKDPTQAKFYQVRYVISRKMAHYPNVVTTIEYVMTFAWTPAPVPM